MDPSARPQSLAAMGAETTAAATDAETAAAAMDAETTAADMDAETAELLQNAAMEAKPLSLSPTASLDDAFDHGSPPDSIDGLDFEAAELPQGAAMADDQPPSPAGSASPTRLRLGIASLRFLSIDFVEAASASGIDRAAVSPRTRADIAAVAKGAPPVAPAVSHSEGGSPARGAVAVVSKALTGAGEPFGMAPAGNHGEGGSPARGAVPAVSGVPAGAEEPVGGGSPARGAGPALSKVPAPGPGRRRIQQKRAAEHSPDSLLAFPAENIGPVGLGPRGRKAGKRASNAAKAPSASTASSPVSGEAAAPPSSAGEAGPSAPRSKEPQGPSLPARRPRVSAGVLSKKEYDSVYGKAYGKTLTSLKGSTMDKDAKHQQARDAGKAAVKAASEARLVDQRGGEAS